MDLVNTLFFSLLFFFVPAVVIGILRGLQAVHREERHTNFPVSLCCTRCGTQFTVPLSIYGRHLWTKKCAQTVQGQGIGAIPVSMHLLSAEKTVFCPSCMREEPCVWMNESDFPVAKRRQIVRVFWKNCLPWVLLPAILIASVTFLLQASASVG